MTPSSPTTTTTLATPDTATRSSRAFPDGSSTIRGWAALPADKMRTSAFLPPVPVTRTRRRASSVARARAPTVVPATTVASTSAGPRSPSQTRTRYAPAGSPSTTSVPLGSIVRRWAGAGPPSARSTTTTASAGDVIGDPSGRSRLTATVPAAGSRSSATSTARTSPSGSTDVSSSVHGRNPGTAIRSEIGVPAGSKGSSTPPITSGHGGSARIGRTEPSNVSCPLRTPDVQTTSARSRCDRSDGRVRNQATRAGVSSTTRSPVTASTSDTCRVTWVACATDSAPGAFGSTRTANRPSRSDVVTCQALGSAAPPTGSTLAPSSAFPPRDTTRPVTRAPASSSIRNASDDPSIVTTAGRPSGCVTVIGVGGPASRARRNVPSGSVVMDARPVGPEPSVEPRFSGCRSVATASLAPRSGAPTPAATTVPETTQRAVGSPAPAALVGDPAGGGVLGARFGSGRGGPSIAPGVGERGRSASEISSAEGTPPSEPSPPRRPRPHKKKRRTAAPAAAAIAAARRGERRVMGGTHGATSRRSGPRVPTHTTATSMPCDAHHARARPPSKRPPDLP